MLVFICSFKYLFNILYNISKESKRKWKESHNIKKVRKENQKKVKIQ
jgi:hypothetical protein